MAEIVLKEGESLENALRRFKRKCQVSGLVAEIRKREFYESPSVRRKKKDEASARKLTRRLQEY